MIKHGPAVPKREGTERWLYEVLRRLQNSSSQAQGGLAAIIRGEAPDGSGRPLFPSLDDYFYLPGRSGGQIGHGATEPGGDLTLSSTKDTSKGSIFLGSAQTSLFDETNERIGLEVAAPTAKIHMAVAPVTPNSAVGPDVGSWGLAGAATRTLALQSDDGDTSYVLSGSGLTYTVMGVEFSNLTNPGTSTGWSFAIRFKKVVDPGVHGLSTTITKLNIRFELWGGAAGNESIAIAGDIDPWAGVYPDNLDYETWLWTLTTAEINALRPYLNQFWIKIGMVGSGGSSNEQNSTFVRITRLHCNLPTVEGGGTTETLQTWQTPTYDNSLDFAADGSAATTLDLAISGDAPLRVSSGGGTSGLRLLTSSTNGRIESGTAGAENMNMVLSGTRATQGTQLTLNYINTLLSGSLSVPLGAKTTTYTILATDCVITCDGTFTVTLPTAVGVTGKLYDVKNIGTGVITVATTSSQTIDGGTTATLRVQYESITVISNGSNWEII